ncbi:uroporphyrinogen-III synthase [Luteimonas wenzhouensis]|jgi:uroporphyrinogen-III synthase|uniref:Uroporphyrinogen-III synthase n=1 Tax=Luteimonas wenzhouensis TaxID=2599615 RepID=A0A5C5TZ15_9GAMM|nr:uroporphyrinogen-III synthase [Luteimonas wenzhouensis]NLW96529.1 uroporphyrinogen-III synthase [Xanthomonadaceae bacterium]TWT18749.1 uroporphyrinogen-III synthase [Luteimonas wenzhouensis]
MAPPSPQKLRACYVISLRPVGQHASMRRAAAAHGARVLALSPWRIRARGDAATRAALRDALAADIVLFTSPAAVHAAAGLRRLRARPGQAWLAVGEGTARALRRAGVSGVLAPTRMDSEGVLALPALASLRGRQVALVTAPGGRGLIAPTLAARGAQVLRADVYERVPAAPAPQALARLRGLRAPLFLALGSGEALQRLLEVLPADLGPRLRRARVLAASDRLAAIARAAGFDDVVVAADARPRSLLAAAARGRIPRSATSTPSRSPH